MKVSTHLLLTILWLCYTSTISAPTNAREQKSLAYFDYIQPEGDFENYVETPDDYSNLEFTESSLARTLPPKNPQKSTYNSPIYYIRLPPQPYMYISGLGYVSQPSQPDPGAFLNVPVSFLSNGKPGMIYQWNGGLQTFPSQAPPKIKQKPKPKPQPDSIMHRLPGKFVFNGKPSDVYVLGDHYNLYNDALQSFYP